jgi:hypothetical protein
MDWDYAIIGSGFGGSVSVSLTTVGHTCCRDGALNLLYRTVRFPR